VARLQIGMDLGAGATLGALSAAVEDLSVLLDLGLRVDAVAGRRDAETEIERWWADQPSRLLQRSNQDDRLLGDLNRLLKRRRREDEISDQMGEVPPEIWIEEWYRLQRSFGGKGLSQRAMPPLFWSLLAESRLSEVAPNLYAHLVAEEVGRRSPTVPRVERLSYENPLEVILIGIGVVTGAGFKFGTFTELAKLVRDWSVEKRQGEGRVTREAAEVDRTRAETRELNARASKAELETEILRRYALQGNRLGDLVEVGLAPRELQAVAQLTAANIDLQINENEV
jgi:hypothetical protein